MFGKKKKNEPSPPEVPPSEPNAKERKTKGGRKKGAASELVNVAEPLPVKRKSKFFSKKIIFACLILAAVGVSASVVYKIYFAKKSSVEKIVEKRVYVKQTLPNIILAEEVIRFTYDFIPEVYDSLVLFNSQMILFENEIKRLTALGEQFPDQVKISEKERKSFEKEQTKLKQTYEKLEKKVEALYVSYRVNQETGIKQIEEQKKDIINSINDALAPALELTRRLKIVPEEKIPEGFVKGTIYKIKKKLFALIK